MKRPPRSSSAGSTTLSNTDATSSSWTRPPTRLSYERNPKRPSGGSLRSAAAHDPPLPIPHEVLVSERTRVQYTRPSFPEFGGAAFGKGRKGRKEPERPALGRAKPQQPLVQGGVRQPSQPAQPEQPGLQVHTRARVRQGRGV